MNDLDELRAALREPPGFAPRPVDVGAVLAAGGRIRRRRRSVVAAALVLVLAVGGALVLRPERRAPVLPVTPPPQAQGQLGELVETGIGQYVIYIKRAGGERGVPWGVAMARRLDNGWVADARIGYARPGDARTPGFHGLHAPLTPGVPVFGYYAGRPARVTVHHAGHVVTARQAPWSEDPAVTLFWFDPALAGTPKVQTFRAYAADGSEMPLGDTAVTSE